MTAGSSTPDDVPEEDRCPRCREIVTGKRWNVKARGGGKVWKGVCTACRQDLLEVGRRPVPWPLDEEMEPGDPLVGGTRPDDAHLTDWGNAKRLVARWGKDLRYCPPQKSWYVWDGARWERDDRGNIFSYAKETVRALYREAWRMDDDAERKRLVDHAVRSEQAIRLRAMIELAQSEQEIVVLPDQMDSNPWLFNCQNGTIDLRTGEISPHQRERLLTRISPAAYDPTAEAPRWIRCLHEWANGDEALIGFLRRAAGYALTGSVREECLFVLYGSGRNGKGKFVGAIEHVLGDYARGVGADTLLASRDGFTRSTNDIASLVGIRFAPTFEVDQGRRLSEGFVKHLTGGDRIKARFLYQEFFEFDPQFKLFLSTNYKPTIRGTDPGIWERIKLIPFEVYIPPEKREANLAEVLKGEADGILAWMVKACTEWQAVGLDEPSKVTEAVRDYRSDEDLVGAFLDARCVVDPSVAVYPIRELYLEFLSWAEDSKEPALSKKAFSTKLEAKGFKRSRASKGTRGFVGLRTAFQAEIDGVTGDRFSSRGDTFESESVTLDGTPSGDASTDFAESLRARARVEKLSESVETCHLSPESVTHLVPKIAGVLKDGMARSARGLAGVLGEDETKVTEALEFLFARDLLEKSASRSGRKTLYRLVPKGGTEE
jgi:P4 family phage/plasmid primase-like protien